MILYHGTKKEYLDDILKNGLIRGKNNGDTVYIYTAKTPKEASKWGEVILEIDATGLNLRHFWGENPIWQILIMEDVKPGRIQKYSPL